MGGIYYDWYSGTYRSTDYGHSEVPMWEAMSVINSYATALPAGVDPGSISFFSWGVSYGQRVTLSANDSPSSSTNANLSQYNVTLTRTYFKNVPSGHGDGLPNWVGNSINAASTTAGTFQSAYIAQAGQTLRYGQRINGVVRSAQTLTRANSISSLSAARTFSRAGTGLALVSAGATVIDAIDRGEWQGHHTADLAITAGIYVTAASFPVVGWIAGGVYFAADLTTQYYTGKSITQNLFDQ